MAIRLLGVAMVAVSLLLAGDLQEVRAQGPAPAPGVFQNYYVAPYYGQTGAQLYVCPRPVPPNVGWTYVTYPGLMPHQFLYQHSRLYWNQHPDGGCTRTMIIWH